MSTKNLTFTAKNIDWSKMKVYEQSGNKGIEKGFNKGFNQHVQFNGHIEGDKPSIESGEIKGDALGMTQKFNKAVGEKYEKSLLVTKDVLDRIFRNATEVNIFLGEIENEGLIFMFKDSTEEKYYIINNCDEIIDIGEEVFTAHQDFYVNNLKSTLDTCIPAGDPDPGNTKRFVVTTEIYNEFLNKSAEEPTLKFVVSFYPALHVVTDKYNNRLTFIMVVEKFVGNELVAAERAGLYDRNGLCPPGNC